jgi:hypothetical protein
VILRANRKVGESCGRAASRRQRNYLYLSIVVNSQSHNFSALAAQPEMLHGNRTAWHNGDAGFHLYSGSMEKLPIAEMTEDCRTL